MGLGARPLRTVGIIALAPQPVVFVVDETREMQTTAPINTHNPDDATMERLNVSWIEMNVSSPRNGIELNGMDLGVEWIEWLVASNWNGFEWVLASKWNGLNGSSPLNGMD